MANPMRAANRKPIPKYMMDSCIERRARTCGHLSQWMLPRGLAVGRYHARNGIERFQEGDCAASLRSSYGDPPQHPLPTSGRPRLASGFQASWKIITIQVLYGGR